jgi:hypothetical protein
VEETKTGAHGKCTREKRHVAGIIGEPVFHKVNGGEERELTCERSQVEVCAFHVGMDLVVDRMRLQERKCGLAQRPDTDGPGYFKGV